MTGLERVCVDMLIASLILAIQIFVGNMISAGIRAELKRFNDREEKKAQP